MLAAKALNVRGGVSGMREGGAAVRSSRWMLLLPTRQVVQAEAQVAF